MKVRRLALSAVAVGSLTIGAAAPAFASEPGPGPSSGPGPGGGVATTSTTSRGREILSYLDELMAKVRASSMDAARRDQLLARLASARNAFASGHPLPTAEMQALLRDVLAGLGVPAHHDEPVPGATSTTEHHSDDTPRSTTSTPGQDSRAALVARLDALSTRVRNSALNADQKASLLAAIAVVHDKVAAGQALGREELGTLFTQVTRALEAGEHDGEHAPPPTTGPGGGQTPPSEPPHEHGPANPIDAIDRARDAIAHANLDPEVRQRLLDAIDKAKGDAQAEVGSGGDGHAAVRAYVDARIAELRARLSRLATLLEARLNEAAAAHPDDPNVGAARDALAAANQALAAATTPTQLRAAWAQLRDVKKALDALG